MRTLTEQLSQYASYHRDRRNIATHFAGIPMILLATCIFLSRPVFPAFRMAVSPAVFVAMAAGIFYLALDARFGIAMCTVLALCLAAARWFAAQGTMMWLGAGAALFVMGWAIQLIGHQHYEGRKPAFLDDLMGLLIGPLFVVAEAGFALGFRKDLAGAIEANAGPTLGNAPESSPEAKQVRGT